MRSLRRLFVRIFPKVFIKLLYFFVQGQLPNMKNPTELYEKLLWLNFNQENPLMKICADKYAVREYVSEQGLSSNLNELLAVYDLPDEINFSSLPEKFVLKCTHGSGMNIVCSDKSNLDYDKTQKLFKKWFKVDYSDKFAELHYRGIPKKIVCEKYLGSDILDYKVYCFNGNPTYLMLCDRMDNNQTLWYLYDFDWNYIPFLKNHLPDPKINKPDKLDEIYDFCSKLSHDFKFVRVDFYLIESRIIFGELTFTPSNFIDKESSREMNLRMGKLLKIR